MSTKWISISGKIEVIDNGIKYVPTPYTEGPQVGQYGFAIAKSNLLFENGVVQFDALLKDSKSRCQLILNHGLQQELFIGLNAVGPYGIGLYRNQKWDTLAVAGFGDTLAIDTWYSIKVRVNGSVIELYINDIKVCVANENIFKSQIALFFDGAKEIEVRNIVAETAKPKAFIVMQFTEEFNALYNEVIKPTCETYGFECIRADDIYSNGLIIDDITKSIKESSIIIADITPNNPNVYYEVGFAHGIAKPTILLSDKKREQLPFDVSGFRTLFYDNTIGGKSIVETRLKKHLENMMV